VIELELPYPPSVNHYYRHVGRRTLISREGRRYRDRVASILATAGVRPTDGRVELRIEVYPPDRRRRDLDNLQKALWDAIQHGGAYHDDSQVKKVTAEMLEPVAGGRVIVRIQEAE
jgi:crossover junction endodeoxyribonuclease RusA